MILKFRDALNAALLGDADPASLAILANVGVTADILANADQQERLGRILEGALSDQDMSALQSAGVDLPTMFGGKVPAGLIDTGERIQTGTGEARILHATPVDPRDPLAFLFSAKRADGTALPPKGAQTLRMSLMAQADGIAVRAYRDTLRVLGVALPSETHANANASARDAVRSSKRLARFATRFNLDATVTSENLLDSYRHSLPVSVTDDQDQTAQEAARNARDAFIAREAKALRSALRL